MGSMFRRSLLAALLIAAGTSGSAVVAQTMSTISRPDGTRIETTIFSPTSLRVTVSGGPDFADPMTVNYTNISFAGTEIVYEGSVTWKGTTQAVTCRVNTTTGAVTGTGACQNALGGSSGGTGTGGTGTGGTFTGTDTGYTGTTGDGTGVTVVTNPRTAAEQARAWVRSGAYGALLPGHGISQVIGALANVSETGLDPFFEAMNTLASDVDRAAAARQLEPVSPGMTATAAVATAKSIAGTVLGRAVSVRGGTGVSTGDLVSGLGLWVQPFGHRAVQDFRSGQDGYEDRTVGLAVGADTAFSDSIRAGLALSYARTGIDGRDGARGDSTDIDGGYANLYLQYEGRPVYVVAQVGGGFSGYDGRRYIATTNQTADADYRGWQVGARVDAGVPLAVGGNWQVTPMAGLAYLHSHTGSYTESGAGALNLGVDDAENNALTGNLGGRVSYDTTADGTTWTPYVQVVANYDFIGDRPDVTSGFASAGAAGNFVTQGAKPARLGADLTLGLNVVTAGSLSFAAAYTFGVREDYQSHGGGLRVRMQY